MKIKNEPMGHRAWTWMLLLLVSIPAWGQLTNKSTLAVAYPSIQGLHATPEIGAKLIRLELLKLEQYQVYDEFDMADVISANEQFQSGCYGINCLLELGTALHVDYVAAGSIDGLGNKIVVNLKVVDVKNKNIHMSGLMEFDDQEIELQRMIEIVVKDMHDIAYEPALLDRLKFQNEPITSSNVGRINNSGPRIGYAMMTGSLYEFAQRPEQQGGLDIFPGISMIGYQLEGQYVGTENFSALIEGLIFLNGMEQGVFIPSVVILNGFRFGNAGWEIAFGPGFTLKRTTEGFFDSGDVFGLGKDHYFSQDDWNTYIVNNGLEYFDPDHPDKGDPNYLWEENLDKRGDPKFATNWIIGGGRTFRAGALNIPVNAFYSSHGDGGYVGASVGFNVERKKERINN